MMELLIEEMNKLHARHELSKTVPPDYYEPGMMEYLEESDGYYDEATNIMTLRFEAKGTRYDNRTEFIEKVNVGDEIIIERDPNNEFNSNNFMLLTAEHNNVGAMPASLCNAIAPLYDEGKMQIISSNVSFVEPISKRSRYAKQAMLFVEIKCKLIN